LVTENYLNVTGQRGISCISIGLENEEDVSSGYRKRIFPGSCNQLLALLGWNDGTEKNYSHWKN
jgi:hypothetical protein